MVNEDNKHLNPEHWVDLYADYLYYFAISRIEDEELCKDLVQDTFLAAIHGKDNFKGQSSERTWLTAILKNKIYDVYRKKKTTILEESYAFPNVHNPYFFEEESGHWNANFPKEWSTIHEPLQQEEFANTFNKCLEKLSVNAKQVISGKFLDEQDTDFICKELSLSSSNYWVIMHRAKLQLRDCLEKNWFVK